MSRNNKCTIRAVNEIVMQNCVALEKSNKTLEAIYNLFFFRDGVLCETSGEGGVIRYTYSDFRGSVDRVSTALYNKVGEGSFVAIYGKNSFEWMVALWAVLKSGNKPFLLNMLHTSEAMASAMDTLGCKLVLCTHGPSGLGKDEVLYSELDSTQAQEIPAAFADYIALSTSGTTLSEKLCIYSGEVITNQLLNAPHIIKEMPSIQQSYDGNIKMLMVLPLYHIFGLEASYLWFLLFGTVFVFPPTLAPSVLLSVVKRHKVTHIFSVPLLWQSIEKSIKKEVDALDDKTRSKLEKALNTSIKLQKISPAIGEAFARKALKSVRNKIFGDSVRFCISGGAHIGAGTLRLINALGYPLYNGYGMTEIGIICANFRRDIDQRLNESIGPTFASIESKIGEDGHLLVRGSSICREVIIDGERISVSDWFDTGDIVTQNEYGGYEISGRASDLVINADGENLNPDIAQHALSLPSAAQFAVMGNEANNELILVVQIKDDITQSGFEALKEEVKQQINSLPPTYSIRKVYYTTDMIVEANEIKISRKKLRNRINSGSLRLTDGAAPKAVAAGSGSELEAVLKEIFAQVLQVEPDEISPDAHFMNDLGGTSLEYYDVMYRLEERFGIKVDFEVKDFGYTLSDFERIIKERMDI